MERAENMFMIFSIGVALQCQDGCRSFMRHQAFKASGCTVSIVVEHLAAKSTPRDVVRFLGVFS